jgi:hypothetical protein
VGHLDRVAIARPWQRIASTVFHDGTCVILLVQDLQTHVINAATGELLRYPTLEPSRDYQPTGAPKGPSCKPRNEQHPDLHS